MLIDAVQQQQQQLEKLREANSALTARIETLEKLMAKSTGVEHSR